MSTANDEANRKAYIGAIKHEIARSHRTLKKDGLPDTQWVDTLNLEQSKGVWLAMLDVSDAYLIMGKH